MEQKGSDLIATVKKHGGNKQNEDWHGSERRGRFAAFPSCFSAAKVFYDLRLDLRIEHLPFLRGYGAGRRGQGNERDAAARSLRGRCAAEAAALTWIGGRQTPRNADFSGYLRLQPHCKHGEGVS